MDSGLIGVGVFPAKPKSRVLDLTSVLKSNKKSAFSYLCFIRGIARKILKMFTKFTVLINYIFVQTSFFKKQKQQNKIFQPLFDHFGQNWRQPKTFLGLRLYVPFRVNLQNYRPPGNTGGFKTGLSVSRGSILTPLFFSPLKRFLADSTLEKSML